ncbi:siderophore-interacting protein [Hoyosella rhizosphaerae]|uniref:Siderophore-interacting protein n=1 Tax=Hoyosella rhizosphaerae TaxID=1755582 RepID=A0A916TYV5_9ACTN|nr:siderophore-interacting protein [Hoyosella rhizosphaerae]MBN4927194.1 siderophore-interacting protein [Hoyosella rhizosphaerae]GGC53279.1 siderophore-interacting protein [Hoyosella rhizosphaerae]
MNLAMYHERLAEVLASTHSDKVPYPIGLRELEVVRRAPVGSGLVRITFGGPELEGFVSHVADEHLRLIFPDDTGALNLPERDGLSLRWTAPRPISREYSVRRFDRDANELDIEFVLHPGGLASEWAATVQPGERIHIAGPPGGVVVPDSYDRYLLAGDITALPAIARWLEMLPRSARGWAVIEVADASEEVTLDAPEGVVVQWLHRGDAAPGTTDLLEVAVRAIDLPAGERVYIWISGEAGSIKPLRRWVRAEAKSARGDHLITGYWKRGVTDFDDHD